MRNDPHWLKYIWALVSFAINTKGGSSFKKLELRFNFEEKRGEIRIILKQDRTMFV